MKHGDKTKQKILEAGIKLWLHDPLHVTARKIATQVDLKHQTILYHYSTDALLRDAVAAYAVKTGESRIIVQLVASGHIAVADMSKAEMARHFKPVLHSKK